jgi:DUF1680 family protein
VNLYIPSKATAKIGEGKISVKQTSDFPWEGEVKFTVTADQPRDFKLRLRVPHWWANPAFRVNGAAITPPVTKGYATLDRKWATGDTVEVSLPMTVDRLESNPKVVYNRGKVALRRGAIIYALEETDQEAPLDRIAIPKGAALRAVYEHALFGGAMQVRGDGVAVDPSAWANKLYQPAPTLKTKPTQIKAVPYAIWGNRGQGKMIVWVDAAP